jgi:arylsulfatase A-like enzyme
VHWPARFKKSDSYTEPVITMDWTATILSAAAAKPPASYQPAGINILPLLDGNKDMAERTFYWRLFQRANHQAIRQGKWKYLKTERGEFLYNLAEDPKEEKDVKDLHAAVFSRLQQQYGAWQQQMLPPIPLKSN